MNLSNNNSDNVSSSYNSNNFNYFKSSNIIPNLPFVTKRKHPTLTLTKIHLKMRNYDVDTCFGKEKIKKLLRCDLSSRLYFDELRNQGRKQGKSR